jgi:hypothetical protein
MAKPDTPQTSGGSQDRNQKKQSAPRHWRARFIEHLAETSNVLSAADHAGITPCLAYRTRRNEPDFAKDWRAALAEGYIHLEMEIVRRLRQGDFKAAADDRYDVANAIRLLAARGDTAGGNHNGTRDVSAAEVRASIDRKIEEIRRRVAQSRPDGSQDS